MAAQYFIVEVTHGVGSRSDMYGSTILADVFNRAAIPATPQNTNVGGWVSGRPRVTRTGGLSTSLHDNAFTTTAADLYEVPDGNSASRTVSILQAVKDRVAQNISRLDPATGRWSDVSVVRWMPVVNGSVDWWRDGSAARTTTEEEPPAVSTDANENPRGPTGSNTHPTTPAETLQHMMDALGGGAKAATSLAWSLAALGGVGLLAYGAYLLTGYLKLLPSSEPAKPSQTAPAPSRPSDLTSRARAAAGRLSNLRGSSR